ncbi:MAG: hypothetical protein SFW36_18225 [Leptolyngbyaceae cyanobacterium bins.59]|nr:hypothetical protein [Leptolyngbyaceae cyanobacterium bins.59]
MQVSVSGCPVSSYPAASFPISSHSQRVRQSTAQSPSPSPVNPQTHSVKTTVERILTTRMITRNDQRVFMNALLAEGSLSEEEQIQVNWVFDGLRRGDLRVVD